MGEIALNPRLEGAKIVMFGKLSYHEWALQVAVRENKLLEVELSLD